MATKKSSGNRTPQPPTTTAKRAMWAVMQPPRDPWAITAPVDPGYRYRTSEVEYVQPSDHDLYAGLVAYRPEEE